MPSTIAVSRTKHTAKASAQLTRLVTQVSTIVDNACKKLSETIAKNCAPARDISGMRELALDNAAILWPILHPKKRQSGIPPLKIIVLGVVPTVHAEIICSDAYNRNFLFFRGPAGTSAGAAVERLLETTMLALDIHYHGHVFSISRERWVPGHPPYAAESGWACE